MVNRIVVNTMIAMILFAACGSNTSREGGEEGLVDPYSDPPGYSGDPFAGYGPVASVEFPASGENPIPRSNPGGWSVQVAACATEEAAQSLAISLESLGNEPVFIDHIGSYYKVRVGSFETAEASSELRNRLRSGGFPDAWSVERETTP